MFPYFSLTLSIYIFQRDSKYKIIFIQVYILVFICDVMFPHLSLKLNM